MIDTNVMRTSYSSNHLGHWCVLDYNERPSKGPNAEAIGNPEGG